MVSVVMNSNDFDLERNSSSLPLPDEPRVSNNAVDFSLEEQIKASSTQDSEIDEFRVLGEKRDDSRVLDVNGYVVHGHREIEFRVQGDKSVDDQDEVVNPKSSVVGSSDDRMGGGEALGSPSASDSDAVGDDAMGKGLGVDATNDEFRLERRGNLRDDDVVSVGSMKIFDSEFEMGDMVWGKVKSHPWWPGHIYNEAFATSSVRRSRRYGHVLVAFFGDSSYGWFDLTDLVPYEPHYAEKSQQTNSRTFMTAVEESVDEASRRSALGLSCSCRNPHNFRPANVPGYMVVDIVDYEPATIYSVSQIQKARQRFRPAETLSFIKQLAASPSSSESKSFELVTHKAAALAYRRSVFEEFDETYAQAFGQRPARPSESPTPKEPSGAPLSGPLVMAETLGGRNSSSKGTKLKELSKKDRYLFKRQDEAGNLRKAQASQAHGTSSSPSSMHKTSDPPAASSVQKRDQMDTKDIPDEGLDVTDIPAVSVKGISPGPASGSPKQSESSVQDNHFGGVSANDEGHTEMRDGLVKKRKKRTAKHPGGDHSYEKIDISEKKKLRKNEVHSEKPMKKAFSPRGRKDFDSSDSVSQQAGFFVEGNGDELPDLLADLRGLALNPFHSVEKNRPAIVRQFFLKFRALIFLKSSSTSPRESEPSETAADSSKPSSLKKSKLSVRNDDDPRKGVQKRVPSERQEENAAKRAKKVTDVKLLVAEKKAAALEGKAMISTAPPFSRVAKTEQHLKRKSDRPPRVEEPTYLMMKFPTGSSLPSLMELKARFARYGPMDTSLGRVFYKANTCRVAFLYKQDANMACRYAVSNSHFSNVKCLLKPVAETPPQQSGSSRAEDSLSSEPSTGEPRPLLPHQQLKSCLKKPSGRDEPGVVRPINGVKIARVTFNIGEDKAIGASNNANLSSENGLSSSSASVAMDSVNNNQRLFSLNPLQPPLIPTPPPKFLNLPHPRHFEVPPRNYLSHNMSRPPGQASLPPPPPSIDISHQMMSLLTSCHDVVTNLESVLGYVPYHCHPF